MTPDVVKVVATPDFFMNIEFATGEVRRFDMRPCLHYPAFAELKQPGVFLRARVEHGTVVWSEDIDLSADTLFLRGKPLNNTVQP